MIKIFLPLATAVPDTNMADTDQDLSTRTAFDNDDKPDLLELIVDDEIKQFL